MERPLFWLVFYFVKYSAFAAIIAAFFCDFAKTSKKPFFLWAVVCVLYVAGAKVLFEQLPGSLYNVGVLISVVNCIACASVALKLLVDIPKSHMVYAFSVTLEYACFITGNAVWDVADYGNHWYDPWSFLLEMAVLSTTLCLIVRRFITPLYRKKQGSRIWVLLSISPLLGAAGYYVMMNFQGGAYFQFPITTYFCNWILFAALITANAVCVVCVDRSVQAAEYREKLSATNGLLALQREQYIEKAAFAQRTEELRHNFRHQAAAMSELLQKEEYDKLKSYLGEYTQEIPSAAISTGNATADIIFGHYLAIAKEKNISVSYQLTLPVQCRISDLDFTVIIGNCMENAIEASEKLPEGQRELRIRSRLSGDFLLLVFENRFDGRFIRKDGKYYSSKRNGESEGIGLSTVRRAVEQYGGEMAVETDADRFLVKLSVCISNAYK